MSMMNREPMRLHQRVLTSLYWRFFWWVKTAVERAWVSYALDLLRHNDVVCVHPDEQSEPIAELRLLVSEHGGAHSHVEGARP